MVFLCSPVIDNNDTFCVTSTNELQTTFLPQTWKCSGFPAQSYFADIRGEAWFSDTMGIVVDDIVLDQLPGTDQLGQLDEYRLNERKIHVNPNLRYSAI